MHLRLVIFSVTTLVEKETEPAFIELVALLDHELRVARLAPARGEL